MKTSTMVVLGLGALAAVVLLRGSSATRQVTIQTAAGPVSIQVPNVSQTQATSAIAQRREAMIQRIMTNSRLSRADAEARYDQLVPSIVGALATHGIGNYVRSA
jgi:coproporphyrinogen III oxidase-like Fe-S oxidoreductase